MTLEVGKPEDEAVHPILVFRSNDEGIVATIRTMVNSDVKKRMDSVLEIQKFILRAYLAPRLTPT